MLALWPARERRGAWSLAIGWRGVITLLGVTAAGSRERRAWRKASHNANNARVVTAGKMGRNSSNTNYTIHTKYTRDQVFVLKDYILFK